jgi:hypothetical protein
MAAVRTDDLVLVGQVLAHADGDGLHACVEVGKARDLAGLELDPGPFLELAQKPQAAICAKQPVMVHGWCTSCGRDPRRFGPSDA